MKTEIQWYAAVFIYQIVIYQHSFATLPTVFHVCLTRLWGMSILFSRPVQPPTAARRPYLCLPTQQLSAVPRIHPECTVSPSSARLPFSSYGLLQQGNRGCYG